MGKRVLLIDDEADKGWEAVLRKVFKTSTCEDFIVINEKVRDYEALSTTSKRILEKKDFDLYLVDLRLNGLEEDDTIITEAFSGMRVMQKIKSLNQGNQVIIFTASNKAWNLKALLDAGADGYYMKESPEYNFSISISEQNYRAFKRNAEKCFTKNYLREVYVHWENTKNMATNIDSKFIAESDTALEISWEQIKNGNLDFGFLTLYNAIERYADSVIHQDHLSGDYTLKGITVINTVNEQEKEWYLTFNPDPQYGDYFSFGKSTQEKRQKPTALFNISCLLHFNYNKDDEFLRNFGKLNKLRNNIAHGKDRGITTKENLIEVLSILKEIRCT